MQIVESRVAFYKTQEGQRISRGFERQRYVLQDDRSVCLNVFSVASDLKINREVTINLDERWLPMDSYVRIHHGDRLEGAGWFLFEQGSVKSQVQRPGEGLAEQQQRFDDGPAVFCAHPIATDALLTAGCSREEPGAVQLLPQVFLSSPHHFGATGPELAHTQLEMSYLGVEDVTAAGINFEADHYRIAAGNETTGHTHPGEEIWTLKDTAIFLRAEIVALGYEYELTHYSRQDS
ncbi:MAG: hypothetical protein AAF358_00915 [Pseudomonadota bacterium]